MSSFFGHAATGLAIGLICRERCGSRGRTALPLFVLLAICPDFDYLAIWLFDARAVPRITHTLVFCLGVAALARYCLRWVGRHVSMRPPFLALSAAAISHLLLDLAVGVHGLPVLWPLPIVELASPIGLLPSAGRIALDNPYFWRNLLIEAGVLFPVLALGVALAASKPRPGLRRRVLVIAPLWLGFLFWSVSLPR